MLLCGERAGRERGVRLGLAAVLLLAAATPSWSQDDRTIERNIPAVRLSTPPVIDGDLSDPVWQEAAKAERWVDWLNANPQIDQTVVYLGYDDRNFYLGWYCYDSQPKEIVARQTKRGAFPAGDDWVDLNLDFFHTHKFSKLPLR